MRQLRTHRFFLQPIATVLLAISLQACTKWSLVPETQSLTSHPRKTVRLTLVGDAKHMVVKRPTIVGDSLIWNSPERGGVALSQIAWAEARSLDPIATGFFALVGVTFVVIKTVRN